MHLHPPMIWAWDIEQQIHHGVTSPWICAPPTMRLDNLSGFIAFLLWSKRVWWWRPGWRGRGGPDLPGPAINDLSIRLLELWRWPVRAAGGGQCNFKAVWQGFFWEVILHENHSSSGKQLISIQMSRQESLRRLWNLCFQSTPWEALKNHGSGLQIYKIFVNPDFMKLKTLFIRLIIRIFQLVFLVETVFFFSQQISQQCFQPTYQRSRTEPKCLGKNL
jgi:hypothetical protein